MSASGLRKLDYLSFTIGDSTSPAVILEQLRFKFTELGYGRHRYRNGAQANAGGLNVFWDGVTEGMGTHVQISGEGCRLVEAQPWFTSWREFIGGWIERGAKFARVDLAIDDESGEISFDTVHHQVKNRIAVMRAHTTQLVEKTNRKGVFHTLYVGRRTSETMMRCYDKGMQMGEANSWLRFEFEYKGTRADAVARLLVNEGWDTAIGVARSFIEFKDESHVTTDRSRQRPAEWWVKLIDASKHVLKISREANASLLRAWQWLKRQAAPVLAVLLEHEGGDISWFLEMAKEGKPKWTERHRKMLLGEGMLPGGGAA